MQLSQERLELMPQQIPQVRQQLAQNLMTDEQMAEGFQTLGLKPEMPKADLVRQLELIQKQLEQEQNNKQQWIKNDTSKKLDLVRALLLNVKHDIQRRELILLNHEAEKDKQLDKKLMASVLIPKLKKAKNEEKLEKEAYRQQKKTKASPIKIDLNDKEFVPVPGMPMPNFEAQLVEMALKAGLLNPANLQHIKDVANVAQNIFNYISDIHGVMSDAPKMAVAWIDGAPAIIIQGTKEKLLDVMNYCEKQFGIVPQPLDISNQNQITNNNQVQPEPNPVAARSPFDLRAPTPYK